MTSPAVSAADPARRSRLLAVKLAALVRDHAGDAIVEPGVWPGGAALVRNGEAWVLAEEQPQRALGPALAWSRQQGATHLHVLAERSTGILARRAALFAHPPEVWHVEGRTLLAALAEPYPPAVEVPAVMQELRQLIIDGGADPVEEHGVLVGEVYGLEVCRVMLDEFGGEARLEVGVGAHDREAFALLHGNIPTLEALARVVGTITEHRRPGVAGHPLNRLGAERRLRASIIAEPSLVGASLLIVAPPPVPRVSLKNPIPCIAEGVSCTGEPMVVVCSVGIDLDLVPFAADARAALGDPAAMLVLAVPPRDVHAVTTWAAAQLAHPATVVGIDLPTG